MVEGEVGGERLRIDQAGQVGLVHVNARIRDAALRLDGAEAGSVWEFICECGKTACDAPVRLTLSAYDVLKATGAPVLAEGHEPSRAASARRDARELCEDAQALRAQARQQVRRAHENLGADEPA